MTRARLVVLTAFVAVLGVLAVAAPARAQQPPSIEAIVGSDPPSAAIGDRVTLTVRVSHPEDVILKMEPPNIERVDLVTTVPSTTTGTPGGAQVTTFAYTLQPFRLGPLQTGSIRLSWLRADGAIGQLDVPGATLLIAPVRSAADDTLRPLKPQVSIAGAPPAWLRPALAAGIVLAVALLGGLVWLWRRGRAVDEDVEAVPVDTSPERVARDALDALGAQAGPARLDYPAYYGGLAVTVRTYLSARFGFNAYALTTTELERRMVSHGVDRWQARLVGGLLERCDDAVYAHRYPDFASADHDLTVAYEIVELSRPRATGGEGQAALA
ncbi:MAG: hypothetical protein AB7G21_14070 [Dehalococcoidia bacterium]